MKNTVKTNNVTFSINEAVVDRKSPAKQGKVVSVTELEVKVQWADGSVWSYLDKNQRFLRHYVPNTSKVFRKVTASA